MVEDAGPYTQTMRPGSLPVAVDPPVFDALLGDKPIDTPGIMQA